MVGQILAHYKILKKIGSGGMGEVYRARDSKLGREVAIKMLPSDIAASADRRKRFEREAQALAALNHPNIVHVYSVEEDHGIAFIVMELVRGRTLTECLTRNGLELGEFFDLGVQLADAVAAAHGEGITHRDLKPDNVVVSNDGRLKVLDFGLARPAGASESIGSESVTRTKTAEGIVVGTLAYMSPEQAEGKVVDSRSDLFSLGIVFYEMLVGRHPFGGDSPAEVLSSLIKDTPRPIRELRPDIPRELARVIERCLVKEPTRRAQNGLDLRNLLEELKEDWRAGELADPSRLEEKKSYKKAIAAAAVVVSCSIVLVYVLRPRADPALRFENPRQITRDIGVEDFPTWSPDGDFLAYDTSRGDIWVSQVDGGQPVNRTRDHAGPDRFPSWSPDGRRIAFVSDRDGGSLLVMPILAGPPSRIAALSNIRPQWSPDGEELAYLVVDEPRRNSVIEILSVETGTVREVALPQRPGVPEPEGGHDLSWSPDGLFFVFMDSAHNYQATGLWLLRLSDGEVFPLTDGLSRDHSPSWSPDARSVYYVSNRGGSRDLWQQRVGEDGTPRGESERVTAGVGMREAVMSPDGTKLVYSKGGLVANVWRLPILSDRSATWADAEPITSDEAYIQFIDVSPNGEWLAVSSDRSGNSDIWVLPATGGDVLQLTSDPTPDWAPRWSPDGERIAFYAQRSGNRDVWVMPSSGGPAKQLTSHSARDWFPSWSPDGRELVFDSSRDGSSGLWVISVEGGDARKLTDDGNYPDWSPDGQWVLFGTFGDDGRIWRVPASGGAPEELVAGSLSTDPSARWSPDGTEIFFTRVVDGRRNFWSLSVRDGAERQLTDLESRRGDISLSAQASDGAFLYFTLEEDLGDIWIMDVVRE